ncbi:zinc-dependent metalloprotease [Gracilimonas sp.]|uniref:zinc-dependent metalloprotease n=1 Tax=Gracilimonas sp. TaxID=1974203 RepID=UPI002871289B|nr:zinc-dependent metalloprotease [Gracilimonas sp.]
MNKIYYLVLTAVFLLGTNAAAQDHPKIISATPQKSISDTGVVLDIDQTVFEEDRLQKGSVFLMDIGSSKTREMIVKRKTSYIPGTISYHAVSSEDPDEIFTFTYSNGGITGVYHLNHEESIFFLKDTKAKQNYLTTDSSNLPQEQACAVHGDVEDLVAYAPSFSSGAKSKSKAESNNENSAALLLESPNDTTVIDVMLVYTENAEEWATNSTSYEDINEIIANSINNSQTALDNSELPIELRVVYVHKNTTYSDDTGDENDEISAGTHLRRFTQNDNDPIFDSEYNGFMQEVHSLRDDYGADLMAAIMNEPETGGIAWRLGSTGGSSQYGFSVNRVQQIGIPGNTTLIHEIGHNMGNAHSRTQSSYAASESGGLFHFSVGFQETNERNATVMAYQQDSQGVSYSRIPIFSSPDLSWQGFQVGTNNSRTPENSALSMNIIKRSIANYRDTRIDPPVSELSSEYLDSSSPSANNINVEMNREDERIITIDIGNTGNSTLMWEVDFEPQSSSSSKQQSKKKAQSLETIEKPEKLQAEDLKNLVNHYPLKSNNAFKSSTEHEEVLYSTSFESDEGFSVNSSEINGYNEWRAQSSTGFKVTSDNPSNGTNHIRLGENSSESVSVYSPFLGYLVSGDYTVEFDFYYTGDNTVEENFFEIILYDGKTYNYSNYLIVANDALYVREENAVGGASYNFSGATLESNKYHTYKIHFNVMEGTNDHYINGNLVYQTDPLSGKTPGVLQIYRRGNASNTIDIDNLKISKDTSSKKWFRIDSENLAGFVRSGKVQPLQFRLNTEGVEAGTYTTKMLLSTNEPDTQPLEIPIELTVNQAVSNETEDKPHKVELAQNYPNPFNPSTTINFTLAQPEDVQLEVFNIQGQKVSTLIENQKTNAGSHQINFDASHLASGIYIYRLKTTSQTLTRQMVLIK